MTEPLIKRVVVAISDLLEALPLPSHTLVIGRRPPLPQPEDCPLLAIWQEGKIATPQTTEWFDSRISIAVAWMEAATQEVELLQADSEIAWAAAEAIETIEAEIRRLAAAGIGVGEAWQVMPGQTTYLDPALAAGLVDGYALEVLVNVTETVEV